MVQTDASKDGLGCVLTQKGHPVAFASRKLSKAEQKCAQIEKELLAIVFACQRFHYFLYGREFVVESDHKPLELETLIKRDIDDVTARLQRIEKTFARARMLYFWPGMNDQIREIVSACDVCEKFKRNQQKEELVQEKAPGYPFHMVSMDLFEYAGRDSAIIDAYSGYLLVEHLNGKTSGHIIKKLKNKFNKVGYPTIIKCDNSPFGSAEFDNFVNDHNMRKSLKKK